MFNIQVESFYPIPTPYSVKKEDITDTEGNSGIVFLLKKTGGVLLS